HDALSRDPVGKALRCVLCQFCTFWRRPLVLAILRRIGLFSEIGPPSMTEVTKILSAIEQGDPHAAEQLLQLVHDELRKLAAQRLAQEKPGQTLEATALVHEAYIRLVGDQGPRTKDQGLRQHWHSRGHFFAAAAEAMRRILVETARRKRSLKRGGQRS